MPEIHTVDLEFMSAPGVIACFVAPCPEGGFVLLETGPASTTAELEQGVFEAGFALDHLRGIFVTHVHLDHSGGAGILARTTGAPVFVHPKGAEHLVTPEKKLLPSAERLYGDMMVPLWGLIEAAPADQVHEVEDGQVVSVSGLDVTARFTPGHAVHHVAWQIGDAVATGDVAGVRFAPANHVMPPMPPPDIDIGNWLESIDKLRRLSPKRLLLTHFGAFDDPMRHLDELERRIARWTETATTVVAEGGDAEILAATLLELDEQEMEAASVPEHAIARYRQLCPMDGNSAGLFRFVVQQ
jgi:glyoxylase-like metal-dependent hydrolase (beta-lactamase superfamily II)